MQLATSLKNQINSVFANKEPWQVMTISASTVLGGIWLWGFVFQEESLVSRSKKFVFRLVRKVPLFANIVTDQISKINDSFEQDVMKRNEGHEYITELPANGKSTEEIVKMIENYLKLGECNWKDGYISGAVYYYKPETVDLATTVYGLASYTNPLHPEVFPGICKMEAEIIKIVCNLFHGGPSACGSMTTGGTESILMACKAYRDYAREECGIRYPEMVIPTTAHPAFHKAAAYLKIKIILVRVDPISCKVDLKAMRRSITRNTCMLVGSAPNFPYGTVDDIEEIAKLGLLYRIPVHVDGCLGGFVLAFQAQGGFPVPRFDFSVPGVTSISADTHKYGFAPKGSSLVLYSDSKYHHYQYFVSTDWPGGIYGSPTMTGSRAGGIIAACWAVMMHFGMKGYVEAINEIVKTTKYIVDRLKEVKGIFIFGEPVVSVFAIGSKDFDIFKLSDVLQSQGWNLSPLQFPSGIHLTVTHMHTAEGVAERLVENIITAVDKISKEPGKKFEHEKMAIYGMAQTIPDRSIVSEITQCFLDSMYFTPSENKQKKSISENGKLDKQSN